MNEGEVKTYENFSLPASVVTKVDVSRMVSDLERVDNEITTSEVRSGVSSSEAAAPAMSDQLREFLTINGLNLGNGSQRTDLIKQLRQLKDKVPTIHMTFAVTTDPESLRQLVAWLRESVHKQAVIEVGLQPALIAGVYVRTPNHINDLSLRAMLKGGRDILIKELEALHGPAV